VRLFEYFEVRPSNMTWSFIVSLTFAVLFTSAASSAAPEPSGFWRGSIHGETPGSLKGGTVIQTEAVAELRDKVHPIFLDVGEADRKPADNAKDVPWIPEHLSIRGAIWLPGAGSGTDDPAFGRAFEERILALTGARFDRPIIVFCHPRCWDGWNGAKRLVILGYRQVFWYPQGVEGWQTMFPTEMIKADSEWLSSLRAADAYE
jgi:PQQ-dependent catabolism-associated CXXCW motif protein